MFILIIKAVEVVGLEFSVQEQVEPIFGYASYTYNKLVKGSRFVSGILTINYTTKNYLIDLLGSPRFPKIFLQLILQSQIKKYLTNTLTMLKEK